MNQLPRGWERTTFGEVADVVGGVQKSPKRRPASNAYPMLRVANVLSGRLDLSEVHQIELFEGELERLQLEPGDCLVVEGNGSISQVGRAAMWRGEITHCVHQNHVIRARALIAPEFLTYWMMSSIARHQIERAASSTSGLHVLSGRKLKVLTIGVPPRAEQDRIVAAIEEHLSRLDAAGLMLESGVHQVGSLAESVLVSAFDPGWPTRSLADVCSVIVDCPHSTATFVDRGLVCIDTTNIRPFGLVEDRFRYVTEQTYMERTKRLEPVEDDVIFAREGTVGTAARVPTGARLCLGQRVMLLRAGPGLRADFLELVMNSHLVRQQYRPLILGTTSPHLNVRDVKSLQIPVPALVEQERAVQSAHEGLRAVERARTDVARVRRCAAGLRRSVLAAAFSGHLVPQDPDDEPASVLLERIRAERAAAAPVRRVRRAAR